ncbi:MAG: ATP-dependent helicase HrpB [Pseudomonadota bacterium]
MSNLPIEPLLPAIAQTLRARKRLILGAPPGAGKTTRVPLALAGLIDGFEALPGKVVMLEPRRIAARMAAERMATTLGEKVGGRIGLSTRIDRRVSKNTVVEVITDGLFTRRLLADPELSGVSAVVFDEIHERGLNADLGLALALDVQDALRDDLYILAMSATLNTQSIASKLDAPVLESEGRQYPIETRYLGRSRDRIEDQIAAAITRAHRETDGSILAFLPGAGEIRRVGERLDLPETTLIAPLFGALSPREQDAAVSPTKDGRRKVVLATDIAESALTIEGVSVVVDSGLARVPETDVSGQTRLVTLRAARANVDQRRGRAGRLGPGICYRLWDEAETKGLIAAPRPEILNTDLGGLLLTLAEWGERDPDNLTWLDAPPKGRIEAARALLISLGALGEDGRLTQKGHNMSRLPLPPRMAALVTGADTPGEKALAARIAAVAGERGIGGTSEDLSARLTGFERDNSTRAKALRRQAENWSGGANPSGNPAAVLAKGWPDMIARKRPGTAATYVTVSGRAGQLDEASPLAKSDWLAIADLVGSAKQARITLAAALDEKDAMAACTPEIREAAEFDPAKGDIKARRVKAMGAIILSETPLPKPSPEASRTALMDHIREAGFGPTRLEDAVRTFVARVTALRGTHGEDWPEVSVEHYRTTIEQWFDSTVTDKFFHIPSPKSIGISLRNTLTWPLSNDIERLAPLALSLPSGRSVRVDWLDDRAPLIECRVQELYGAKQHIMVADSRLPVTIQMLSPGGKPVATTRDLPTFWIRGYADMAKDMRGRYPKHDWPDDPATAKPHAGLTKKRLSQN